MFCNQCEQTAKGTGCTVSGVCGKTPHIAELQDQLIYALRLLAQAVLQAKPKERQELDRFTMHALFSTLTNVNFDQDVLENLIRQAIRECMALQGRTDSAVQESLRHVLQETETSTQKMNDDPDICSAMQLLLYGLKGVAAYADHAAVLGKSDPSLSDFVYKALAAGMPDLEGEQIQYPLDDWLALVMDCGKANLRAMELLEQGNTEHFGDPVPTKVALGHRKGKCILVSGHDLQDLYDLLVQTEGTGINIYTHGEMLPAHGYPKLKAFSHLAGHFGTAWQNQKQELPLFPGPVLFTTNCIQNPEKYLDKVFTSGATGWPGAKHCEPKAFAALIDMARSMPGFEEDSQGKEILAGFGRKTLLQEAPHVLEAVKEGKIRHIFLVGGCDGAKPGRDYYTRFVEATPPDTLILTLACGKFRFFDKNLGMIGNYPRLMDVGQCNDAYAAIQVVVALAKALNCDVNELPVSLILSWYEQKAVSILLTLLSLGVKNIHLGPSLPAFVSPNILQLLVKNWNVTPISTPANDLKAILG